MSMVWDNIGEKTFEMGVDHGALYVMTGTTYGEGVPWNGLTGVTETPSGAEANKTYADNIEYANILSAEEFGATIEALSYPLEFNACNGRSTVVEGVTIGQQNRAKFAFSYRTKAGNDTEGQEHGYQIHIIYGAQASPSEKAYTTLNDSPEPTAMSWDITTTPVPVTGYKPTAHLTLDSTLVGAANMKKVEDILYGSGTGETAVKPKVPLPDEIITLIGTVVSG